MTNHAKLDLQWELLNAEHPSYCIDKYSRGAASSLLIEPAPEKQVNNTRFEKAKAYHARLLVMTEAELALERQDIIARKKAAYEAAHPFNQSEAIADAEVYEHWSRAELWSLGEATALIHGRNPQIVTDAKIESDKTLTDIAKQLKATYELLERARRAGSLHGYNNNPKRLVDWLQLKSMKMPPMLKELTLQRSGSLYSLQDENKKLKALITEFEANSAASGNISKASLGEKQLGTREKESLLKLILGMAIKGYSYNPKATRSQEIKEIANDLAAAGLSLDEDTVRKYLSEAKTIFSDELNRTD